MMTLSEHFNIPTLSLSARRRQRLKRTCALKAVQNTRDLLDLLPKYFFSSRISLDDLVPATSSISSSSEIHSDGGEGVCDYSFMACRSPGLEDSFDVLDLDKGLCDDLLDRSFVHVVPPASCASVAAPLHDRSFVNVVPPASCATVASPRVAVDPDVMPIFLGIQNNTVGLNQRLDENQQLFTDKTRAIEEHLVEGLKLNKDEMQSQVDELQAKLSEVTSRIHAFGDMAKLRSDIVRELQDQLSPPLDKVVVNIDLDRNEIRGSCEDLAASVTMPERVDEVDNLLYGNGSCEDLAAFANKKLEKKKNKKKKKGSGEGRASPVTVLDDIEDLLAPQVVENIDLARNEISGSCEGLAASVTLPGRLDECDKLVLENCAPSVNDDFAVHGSSPRGLLFLNAASGAGLRDYETHKAILFDCEFQFGLAVMERFEKLENKPEIDMSGCGSAWCSEFVWDFCILSCCGPGGEEIRESLHIGSVRDYAAWELVSRAKPLSDARRKCESTYSPCVHKMAADFVQTLRYEGVEGLARLLIREHGQFADT